MNDVCTAVGTLYYHDFMTFFPRHGVVNYGVDFIYALQKKCNYVLLFDPLKNPHEVYNEGELIETYIAAFRKINDDPFMSFQEFELLPGLHNIVYQYELYREVVR